MNHWQNIIQEIFGTSNRCILKSSGFESDPWSPLLISFFLACYVVAYASNCFMTNNFFHTVPIAVMSLNITDISKRFWLLTFLKIVILTVQTQKLNTLRQIIRNFSMKLIRNGIFTNIECYQQLQRKRKMLRKSQRRELNESKNILKKIIDWKQKDWLSDFRPGSSKCKVRLSFFAGLSIY